MRKKILSFVICCAAIILLVSLILPFISKSIVPSQSTFIKERDLDTGALIYSESEEAVEGNYFLLKSKY